MLLDKVTDPCQLTELKDERNCSPLFYAAAECSIANLSLLLESDEDGKVINGLDKGGKNVLFKARTYETFMLLTRYGANRKYRRGNDNALKYFTKKANQEAPLTLLDQQLDEEGEGGEIYYTLNFDILTDIKTNPQDNETEPLELHNCFIENERDDLLLHPLMDIYLELKWRQVFGNFLFFEFMLRLIFVISLTNMAWWYMALTTCEYENDLGFVPKENDTFKPKGFNILFSNIDNKVGKYINKTHSSWFDSSGLEKILPITCVNDYLKHEDETLEPLCQLLREDDIGKVQLL